MFLGLFFNHEDVSSKTSVYLFSNYIALHPKDHIVTVVKASNPVILSQHSHWAIQYISAVYQCQPKKNLDCHSVISRSPHSGNSVTKKYTLTYPKIWFLYNKWNKHRHVDFENSSRLSWVCDLAGLHVIMRKKSSVFTFWHLPGSVASTFTILHQIRSVRFLCGLLFTCWMDLPRYICQCIAGFGYFQWNCKHQFHLLAKYYTAVCLSSLQKIFYMKQ
jgi:hypothetical protein